MFKVLKARFSRRSTDDARAKEREAKRVAKVLASHNAKEHYRPNPSQGGEGRAQ